ncbi:DUF4244 domain-containing protein [Cryobacterium sp.]|jgi:hypothetical protein|uniref:DUF4244 domain-containing protein n=1 Tax=Cryobacterium sp. TaxID=1926290 RepID=UPI002622C356|nr:DUF4244 domain-containing protein [Cryobacterium sp.]MCU1445169.1 hypothetical protein [Cryobacterium sp.]
MTTLTSPPAPSTEPDSADEADTATATGNARPAADAAGSRHRPSAGTGVRNGLVRTRTVRSNSRRALLRMRNDRGAATAEYIVATMAAVGFAGLLIVILRGDEVRGILTELVRSALTVG